MIFRLGLTFWTLCLLGYNLSSLGQPAITGKISGGFQAPAARDNEGRRHV